MKKVVLMCYEVDDGNEEDICKTNMVEQMLRYLLPKDIKQKPLPIAVLLPVSLAFSVGLN